MGGFETETTEKELEPVLKHVKVLSTFLLVAQPVVNRSVIMAVGKNKLVSKGGRKGGKKKCAFSCSPNNKCLSIVPSRNHLSRPRFRLAPAGTAAVQTSSCVR